MMDEHEILILEVKGFSQEEFEEFKVMTRKFFDKKRVNFFNLMED